jgi:hypothetical protein
LRAQFISNLGLRWTFLSQLGGFQVSRREYKEKGARGINKGKKRARGLHRAHR